MTDTDSLEHDVKRFIVSYLNAGVSAKNILAGAKREFPEAKTAILRKWIEDIPRTDQKDMPGSTGTGEQG